jgi:dipeptidyl aminopeptidase/acylaminoacyl peptidase
MDVLKWIVLLGLGGYVAVVAALYFGQRSLLYLPRSTHVSPAAAGLPEAEEIVLDTSDGERVIAWHVPPRPEQPIVIYFHGNAEVVVRAPPGIVI